MMNSNFINLDDYQMICCYLQEVSKYLYIYIHIPLQETECYNSVVLIYFLYSDIVDISSFPVCESILGL